jgi:transcriptional regulator with XRE-family HTH domain
VTLVRLSVDLCRHALCASGVASEGMSEQEEAREATRQDRLRAAGAWLRSQRELRGWSGSDIARQLSITQVRISSYERGQYEVPDEVATGIAEIFDLPVIEVRRQLGLWVPDDADLSDLQYRPDPTRVADDVLIAEIIRRYQQRSDREILEVFPHRSDVPNGLWDQLIMGARSEILLGGYTNYFFWTERANFSQTLRKKLESGVNIRILVGDPENDVTHRREGIEQAALSLTTRIRITLDELAKLGNLPGLEVRMSNVNAEAHVSRSVFRFDREALVCEHIAEKLGHGSLTYHLRRIQEGGPFDQYSEHAEYLWAGARPWSPASGQA